MKPIGLLVIVGALLAVVVTSIISLYLWLRNGGSWMWFDNIILIKLAPGILDYLTSTPGDWKGLHALIEWAFRYLPVGGSLLIAIAGFFALITSEQASPPPAS